MTPQTDFATIAQRHGAQNAPGSPQAVALGCKCPVGENHGGRGVAVHDGIGLYRMGALIVAWVVARGRRER